MSIEERIATLVLLEKIKEDPKYAQRIGLEIVRKEDKHYGTKRKNDYRTK